MKEYSSLSRSLELEPYHQMQFSFIGLLLFVVDVLLLSREYSLACFFCFNGVSTFLDYFRAKAYLVKQEQCYLTHSYGDKEVYTSSKGISRKVNAVGFRDFELTYYDVTVQHFSHCAKGTPF